MSEAGEARMDHAEDEHSLGVGGGRSARLYRSVRRVAGNSAPRRLDALFPVTRTRQRGVLVGGVDRASLSVGVVLRWIEAAALIEPSRERQARQLTVAKQAAFLLGPWLTRRAASRLEADRHGAWQRGRGEDHVGARGLAMPHDGERAVWRRRGRFAPPQPHGGVAVRPRAHGGALW
jgi:hypothetical protein